MNTIIDYQSSEQEVPPACVCTTLDEFIADKCIWEVTLSSGLVVYQDDDRPCIAPTSAWRRLKQYTNENGGFITRMCLRFGTHIVEMPSNKYVYYYSKGYMQAVTRKEGLDFHIVGWNMGMEDDRMECLWYKVPELIHMKTTYKAFSECSPQQLMYS